jgi:hypothetical protein
LFEQRPLKTKTAIQLYKILCECKSIPIDEMLQSEIAFKQLYPNDTVHFKVYSFVRQNQHLWVTDIENDPYTSIQNWGRKLAADHGLKLAEITYDSEMLHFVFYDRPKLKQAVHKLYDAALASGFIIPPFAIGDFEMNTDLEDVEPDQVAYTMCFYRPEQV